MKKSLFLGLAIFAIAFSFMGCGNDDSSYSSSSSSSSSSYSDYTKDYSITITNATDVNLVVTSVVFFDSSSSSDDLGDWNYGSLSRGTVENINKTISSSSSATTISVDDFEYSATSSSNYPDRIGINCYYTTDSNTTAYPYVGSITSKAVSKYTKSSYSTVYYKTNEAYLGYKEGIMLNFVKTTSGDYVLAVVK